MSSKPNSRDHYSQTHDDPFPSSEAHLAVLAQRMILGEVGIVEGCRSLTRLLVQLESGDDELFIPIFAVESETEDFPVGTERSLWSESALQVKDAEVGVYLNEVRGVVLDVCRILVKRYSNNTGP